MEKIGVDFKDLKKHYDRVLVRQFKDMKNRFKDSSGVVGNPVIYRVFMNDFFGFESGLTVIEPGAVNGEFYMTMGHKHVKPTREIYILLSGNGKLLIQGKKSKVYDLKKDKVFILPKSEGHRLINTGNTKLEVLTIYSKDAGHDYGFSFEKAKRFFRK